MGGTEGSGGGKMETTALEQQFKNFLKKETFGYIFKSNKWYNVNQSTIWKKIFIL